MADWEAEGTVFILVNTVNASTDAPIDAGTACVQIARLVQRRTDKIIFMIYFLTKI